MALLRSIGRTEADHGRATKPAAIKAGSAGERVQIRAERMATSAGERGDLTDLSEPVAGAATAHAIRLRLLWLLLLILPVLPLVQLTQVWRNVGQGSLAAYVATMHATAVVCWLTLSLMVGGMLRRRCRAAERRARLVLAGGGALVSTAAGVGVALALGALQHSAPRWDAGLSVALFGSSVSVLVRLGWPRAGLAYARPGSARRIRARPGVLVPGILLVVAGAVLGHLGDAVLSYGILRNLIISDSPGARLSLPTGVIGHTPLLPLLYGLLTAAGWLLICLSVRDERTRVIGFGYAAVGLAWVAAITNPINGDGLIFTWYGLLPLALGLTALARLRRYRRAA